MASRRKTFSCLTLLCWLCFNFAYSAIPEPSSIVIPNEWELIKQGWPQEDIEDTNNGRKTQFYFLEDKSPTLSWKIKSSFLQQFKDESQIFKLSFKYWSHYEKFRPQSVVTIDNYMQIVSDRYFPDFDGNWMPCEYFMSYQNLTSFHIEINTGDNRTIIAFKDFKIEYETQSQNQKSFYETQKQQTDEYSLIDWEKYSPPDTPKDGSEDFLYFSSNCNDGCLIKSEGIDFSDLIDKSITKVELTFKFWIKDISGTKIELSNGTQLSSPLVWTPINQQIKDTNLKTINLKITTMKTGLKEDSFVAIKDLKITISYKNNDKEPKNLSKYIDCAPTKCQWKLSDQSDQSKVLPWYKPIAHLEPNSIYYYPKSKMNSLEIRKNDDLNKTNVCFSIKYWVAFDKDLKINVNLNVKNETIKDTILTIRPQVNKNNQLFETTNFCLRELVAFIAKDYVISFNVEQFNYTDGINGFALKIEPQKNEAKDWTFDEKTQTFLQPMKIPFENDNGPISGQWKEDWIQLSPETSGLFEFKQEFIEFTAISESKTPSSAQLISKWIKYDKNLHLIDPQYSVNVSNSKLFESFKIRPKVCDWLSHCNDVMQKLENDDKNLRLFSFKFNPLRNSQYIKLLFYIEYFQPTYYKENELEIKFDFKLVHFGDPCFNAPKCQNNGKCVSDFKKDIPNKPSCSCTQSSTGPTCEKMNYCGTVKEYKQINKNESGSKLCHEIGPNLQCENMESEFRCDCGGKENESKINWDKVKLQCVDPTLSPVDVGWGGKSDKYFPLIANNSRKYKFTNINTTKHDVCIKLNYQSNQIVKLNIDYIYQLKPSNLFSVSLPESHKQIQFCVRDFRYIVHENFELSLQIIDIPTASFNDTTFQLTHVSSYLKKISKNSVPYIHNWDLYEPTLQVDPGLGQSWTSIPDGLFTSSYEASKKNLTQTFSVNVTSYKQSKALLISDWITNNQNFSSSENYYTIQYTKGANDRYFRLVPKIIYQENDEIKYYVMREGNGNSKTVDNFTISENRISIPSYINTPFKLIFEITYFLPPNEKNATNLTITFKSISIGDPCLKYDTRENVCRNKGVCHGFGPNSYFCDCTDTDFGGKNCEFQNICKNTKIPNEEYCGYFPSIANSGQKKCIVLTNTTSECRCPEKDYVWNTNSNRCIRNGYTKDVKVCEGKNCEILDRILSDTKWSNQNMPKVNGLQDKILPFYFSSRDDAQLKIQVNNLDNQNDACFKFQYEISNTANLLISYNNLKPVIFNASKPLNWYPEGDAEEICARSLTKDIDKNFNITLVSKILNTEKDMIGLRFVQNEKSVYNSLNFQKRISNLLSELPYLIHWSKADNDGNYTFENQWPLALPRSQWKNTSDDSIKFEASKITGPQTSYLISNWLRKDIDGYKLRFKISDTDYTKFTIQIVVYDTQMQQKPISDLIIGDTTINPNAKKDLDQTITIPVNKMSTSFRVGFKVDYKLAYVNSVVSFTLKNIDLGDPCVFDNTTDNLCMGRGKCIRNGPINNYTCQCIPGYRDTDCQSIDYCNYSHYIAGQPDSIIGQDYCKQKSYGECANGGYGGFSCSCNNETFWNFNLFACQKNPKCIAKQCDLKTQYCEEPKDANEEAKCVCKNNYVNVSTTSSVKCEKFDPCSQVHRNRTVPPLSSKPCGTSNATCIPFGDTANDYTCVCKKEYETTGDKENTDCNPLFCEFPTLNKCQQNCDIDKTIERNYKCSCTEYYDEDGDKCKLKKDKKCNCNGDAFCNNGPDDCICKRGYKPVNDVKGKNIGCEPNTDVYVPPAICPAVDRNTTDHKLKCDCGSAYKLNDKYTCDLKPICGKGGKGREDCDLKKALCITDKNNVGNYTCLCPTGKELNANNTCIDYCVNNTRLDYCNKRNAECDPTQDNTIEDHEKLCFCRPGFTWNKGNKSECVIGLYTAKFSLLIKNTFYDQNSDKPVIKLAQYQKHFIRAKRDAVSSKFSADLNGLFNDLKSMREENNKLREEMRTKLEPIRFDKKLVGILSNIIAITSFTDAKETIAIEKCELNSNFYNCIFTMSLRKSIKVYESNGNLSQQLSKLCISYPGEPRNCFFPKKDNFYDSSQSDLYSLVIDKEVLAKSSISKYKTCESSKNKNICPGYTKCVDDKDPDLSLYSCDCNPKYFLNYSMEYLLTQNSTKDPRAVKYQCKVRDDLCSDCPPYDKHGKCVQSSPHKDKDNEWIAPAYCRCEDKFILSNNSKSCIGVCEGVRCNHGKCVEIGSTGYACQCNQGWNGDNCDLEYKVKNTVWIIVVAVLGVLVVIAAVGAVYFAIKARNADNDSNDPTQQMTEYSGTSYRVERSRPAIVRTQSSNRGQENTTFHRD